MKKISVIAAAFMALVMGSCSNGTPKAELKSDVDSLCYAIGMANSQGL
jgi:FKBP-type peptidyl-prolyl cis-trans isomerase FklB